MCFFIFLSFSSLSLPLSFPSPLLLRLSLSSDVNIHWRALDRFVFYTYFLPLAALLGPFFSFQYVAVKAIFCLHLHLALFSALEVSFAWLLIVSTNFSSGTSCCQCTLVIRIVLPLSWTMSKQNASGPVNEIICGKSRGGNTCRDGLVKRVSVSNLISAFKESFVINVFKIYALQQSINRHNDF